MSRQGAVGITGPKDMCKKGFDVVGRGKELRGKEKWERAVSPVPAMTVVSRDKSVSKQPGQWFAYATAPFIPRNEMCSFNNVGTELGREG